MNPSFVSPALPVTGSASLFTPRLTTPTRRPFPAAAAPTRRAARMEAAAEDAEPAADAPEAAADAPAADAGPVDFASINDQDEDVEVISELTLPQPVLNKAAVEEARAKFRVHDKDSGSPEFQIASLTTRIQYMTNHLRVHPKDYASTRGLLKMVATRRKLLKYLKSKDEKRFHNIIEGLQIRVSQQLRDL